MRSGRLISCVILFCLSSLASAQSFKLIDISGGDFKRVTDDLSADFKHTSVSGASPLGHLFGFEIGVVATSTMTPNLNRLVHSADSNSSLRSLPGGEFLGALTVPLGLTVELAGLPKIGTSSLHLSSYTLGVKWTVSEVVPLPFDLAVKVQSTELHVDAHQSINDVDAHYKYDGWVHGLEFIAGYDIGLVAPYVGLGLLRGTGDMRADGVVAFAPEYSQDNHGTATRGSTELLIGAEARLLVAKVGVEYARLFDTERWAGKLSVYF